MDTFVCLNEKHEMDTCVCLNEKHEMDTFVFLKEKQLQQKREKGYDGK
jgi:hypothetical protein